MREPTPVLSMDLETFLPSSGIMESWIEFALFQTCPGL